MEDTILSLWGWTWLFRAGLGEVIYLCEEVEGSRHGTGGYCGGADIRQCGPDLGRGDGARKEDMGGREDSARQGEKNLLSVLTFSPKVHTCFARLPVALWPTPQAQPVQNQTRRHPTPQHRTFLLPGMLFSPFHFSPCPASFCWEEGEKPERTLPVEGSGEKFPERVADSAKCQRGEWGWALKKTWGLWAGNSWVQLPQVQNLRMHSHSGASPVYAQPWGWGPP